MSAFVRKPARNITFTDAQTGRVVGKTRILETGGMGNRHFTVTGRKPMCGQPIKGRNGGVSFCSEAWAPVCPNRDCPGNQEPRRIMRIERYGHKQHEIAAIRARTGGRP